jgi:hypothetical protein
MNEPMSQIERPAGGGLAGAIGPEAVAALLSVVVVVALVGGRFATAGAGVVGPTPSPTSAATDAPVRTASIIDFGAIQALLDVNQNLADAGVVLQGELKTPPVDTQAVRNTFSNMRGQLNSGKVQADRLARTPAGASVAAELRGVYTALEGIIGPTTGISLLLQAEFLMATKNAVAEIAKLPPMNEQLDALQAGGPGASPSGVPSTAPSEPVSPSPSAVASPTPVPATPTLAPTPTPVPSTPASVPPSVAPSVQPGPNEVLNPGFEEGVGPPWRLVLTGPADATLSPDNVDPLPGGKQSARIDIYEPTLVPTWISLQQPGIEIDAGAYYLVSVSMRSSASRSVLIRIATPSGQTLGTGSRRVTINPAWSTVTFPMTSIAPSDNAMIAIDFGGSPVTVWVDDVSVSRVNSGAP